MKRKLFFLLLLFIFILLTVSPFIFTTLHNDNDLLSFSQQLFNYQLPENAAVIEEISYRMYKEKNMVEYYAILFIKSDLDLNAVTEKYNKSNFAPGSNHIADSINITVYERDCVFYMPDGFHSVTFEDDSPYSNYYEIVLSDCANFSILDLKSWLN